jgi:GAF domain-containing protein
VADDQFSQELRETFTLATFAGAIASPFGNSRLLRMIVETASYFLSAQAASLFLIDEKREELVVACALGPKADLVEQIRVPLGHGIAGLVAVSGQAIAISDVVGDPRHAADVSRILGHVPQSILCVPLLHNDQVIGVLELLDKEDGSPFSAADIEALDLFADQAAVALEQSRTLQHLASLISEVLALLGESPDRERLRASAHEFAQRIEENATYRRSLELAQLVQEIGRYGDHELDSCRTILSGFADYLRSSARPLGGAQQSL